MKTQKILQLKMLLGTNLSDFWGPPKKLKLLSFFLGRFGTF